MNTRRTIVAWILTGSLLSSASGSADPWVYEPAADPGVGVLLISWANFGAGGAAIWEAAVEDVYAHGFRDVTLCPLRFVDLASGDIRLSDGANSGPETAHIEAALARSQALGVRVTLNPFVEPDGFSSWRGSMNFSGPAKSQFWKDYRAYLVEIAAIAESHSALAMTVGSELRTIVRDASHNAEWATTLSAVDTAFSGQIGYASNWDNYRHANLTATLWESPLVDFMGVDTYHPLARPAQAAGVGQPEVSILEAAWNSVLDTPGGGFNHGIVAYAAARKGGVGMPVFLTEHGSIPYDETSVAPYSQSASSNPPDPAEQVNDYEALLRAADGRRAKAVAAGRLEAIYIWHWSMPGTSGSLWLLDPEGDPVTQGALGAQVLVDFVAGAPVPVPRIATVLLVFLILAAAAGLHGAKSKRRGTLLLMDGIAHVPTRDG